ncbi:hypothetical protein GCM10023321_49860 [Pseudonocardia eucalypti]|uniref:Membrane transport protein MMPL domain-containing protein n=1 Tax=Pseudonocardia eucalypti TaxID=648755 RepID=A0ABP9QK33_9PSEU|nr:putative RND superfamily exporter protein [Pseudonocardia eucalypti]
MATGLAPRPSGRQALVAVVVLGVAGLTFAGLAALRVDTQPRAFLPAGDVSLRDTEAADRAFGADPIVVLAEGAEPGQLLGPEQLPLVFRLEGQLSRLPDVSVVYGPATVLNEIAIASNKVIAQVMGSRDAARAAAEQQARNAGAPPAAVTAAGDTATATFDERYAPLLVQGMPLGLPTLHNPGFVRNLVYETGPDGQPSPRSQWRFVVPSSHAISILVRPRENLDQESTDRLVAAVRATAQGAGLRTTALTVTGAPAVAASLADQVRGEIPLLGGCAVGLIALCYVALPWLGRRRDRLLPIVATLCGTALTLAVFGWLGRPLSLGAMAFLPILIGIGSDFPAYLVRSGQQRRVLVAALASTAGFAALALSPLPFVRDLGLALALGVLLAVALALVLRRWLLRGDTAEQAEPAWRAPALGSRARRAGVAFVALAAAAVGWVALPHLGLEARPDRLAAGMPAVADAQHAEEVLGSSGEVRMVLRGPDVLSPQALDWMRRAGEQIVLAHGDQFRPILSPAALLRFLGDAPTPEQVAAATTLLPRYLLGAVTTPDAKQAVLSYGIALQDLGDQHRLLDSVRAGLPPLPAGYDVTLTGLPVVAAHGYELVSGDRYLTNIAGIAAAGLVLLIGLRRRADAGRAVMAAALATGWGLAVVIALGFQLSPLTVALGSLTTATACEFTVLLADAVRHAHRAQWRTVCVAALAAAVGYATLALSRLDVIQEFGLLLSLTVLLSLVAAHVVVLVSPGRAERAPGVEARPRDPVAV